jgi:hexosaminidase
MKYRIYVVVMLLLTKIVSAQQVSIVPTPVSIKQGTGNQYFIWTQRTSIQSNDPSLQPSVLFLQKYLQQYTSVHAAPSADQKRTVLLQLTQSKIGPTGAYRLQVSPNQISITAMEAEGIFYGIQTLIQLFPTRKTTVQIPIVEVLDYPRFGYRGMHLDVARHFFPVPFIKQYIDYLALHKFNKFHWHLTEDQGWRIEIKKYPKLTEVGAWRNGTIIGRYPGKGNDSIRYGGFYTQAEIREIVRYAADRYITIIPEIDIPGHSSAAIAAYPQLSCFPEKSTEIPKGAVWSGPSEGKQVQQTWGVFEDVLCPTEYTFQFLQDVFDEVMDLFPSAYIHIGGDECPKANWEKSSFCQQLIREQGLKDEHELQSYFIQRIERYINSKGRSIIGWDEILEGGLAPNATVMSWRGEKGGIEAAKQNHQVIMTPGDFCYFDHSQSKNEDSITIGGYTPLEEVYGYEPMPAGLPADKKKYVWGAQANVWTEYMKNQEKVQYMIFPRIAAMSEALWTQPENKNWKVFESKLTGIYERYSLWGIQPSYAYYDIQASILPAPNGDGLLWQLQSNSKGANIIVENEKGVRQSYTEPVLIRNTGTYRATLDNQTGLSQNRVQQSFQFHLATGKKIQLTRNPTTRYPGNGGGFGLINGCLSDKGLSSPEWLGWNGGDGEATIDLGVPTLIQEVAIHSLDQPGSWVYRPARIEVWGSDDGIKFQSVGKSDQWQDQGSNMGIMRVSITPTKYRWVKVRATAHGIIEAGKAGAGNSAWLMMDEIFIR